MGSKWDPKRSQNDTKSRSINDWIFDRFWELPGGLSIIERASGGANPGVPPVTRAFLHHLDVCLVSTSALPKPRKILEY